MASDRLNEIKDGSFTARDVMWLVSEVERLQAERISAMNEVMLLRSRLTGIHRSLSDAMSWSALGPDDLGTLLTAAIHQRRGAMTELNEIHDILAEALDYQKAPTPEEDPNCPCPGAYVTGDHTAVSLAVEAARKLAIAKRTKTAEYTRTLEKTVAKMQRELAVWKSTKKAELRREIEALRRDCNCPYWSDTDSITPSFDCRTHGTETCNTRLAGTKALNTLAYVRKYFMGSEHGHEV